MGELGENWPLLNSTIKELKIDINTVLQVTTGYELYVTFEPTVDKNLVITLVNKLLSWIKKEEDQLFILNAPTF